MKQKTLEQIMCDKLNMPKHITAEDFDRCTATEVSYFDIMQVAERWADLEVERESKLIEKRIRKELTAGFKKLLEENL